MLSGSALDKLLCSFSPSGDRFALAGPDGRVRVFDTGTGRLVVSLGGPGESGKANGGPVANGHLVEAHTCMAWVVSKEKSKKKQSVSQLGVAVGTAAGDVKFYDVQLGELKWRAVDVVQGGVKSLIHSADQGLLLTTGCNCSIVSLNTADGAVKQRFEASKYPITCIAVAQDGRHVFGGGSSMQLWDLAEQERAAKYTGHPSEVRAVSFVPGQPHAVSAARGERHVAVWDVPPAKKSKKQHPAATTLSLEEPAVQLDTACISEGETFTVAAVSEGGEAYVWLCHRESAGLGGADGTGDARAGLACQLVMRVRVGGGGDKGSRAGREEAILGVRLQPGSAGGHTLLVARGTSAKPAFDSLAVPSEAPAAAADIIISLQPVGGVLLPATATATVVATAAAAEAGRSRAAAAPPQVNILGTDNIGKPVVTRAAAEAAAGAAGPGPGSRKRGAEPEEALEGARGAEEGEEEVPDLPEGEVPLEERVAALETRGGSARGGPAGAAAEESGEPPGTSGAVAGMPVGSSRADSLTVLLTQAIRSNDRVLLERCLSASNPGVVVNTVARLLPMDAALFLRAAVDRLVSKPNRAAQLVPWIRAVLFHHTAYMMTAPGVQSVLTSLFQAIDSRVKLQDPLLRLHGRLGLVLHHTRRDAKAGQQAAALQRPGPEIVFEDHLEVEEEPEAEDPFAPGAPGEEGSEEEEGDEGDSGDGDDDEDDSENEFDAMLADGPGARSGGGAAADDDDDDDDLEGLLSDED